MKTVLKDAQGAPKGFVDYKYYINVQGDMADVTGDIISATYVTLKIVMYPYSIYY